MDRSVLVVFESKYGQSEKIAARIVGLARRRGHIAKMMRAHLAVDAILEDHDLVVVVAPVYYGKHGKHAVEFIRRRLAKNDRIPSAFVSVSGSAGNPTPAKQEESRARVREMLEATGWRPFTSITIGGALAYPRYNFVLRAIAKWSAKRGGGPTDTTRIHESTDWGRLDRECSDLLAILDEPLRGARPRPVTENA